MYRKFLAIIGFFLLLSIQLHAQKYSGVVKKFSVEHGLSHPDVRSVVLDPRGLIWVGTRNGLNRFDGRKFKRFDEKNGLKNNNIEELFADGEVLWCIHKSRTIEAIESITLFNSITEKSISFNEWCGVEKIDVSQINAVYGNQNEIVLRVNVGDSTLWYLKKPNMPLKQFKLKFDAELIGSNNDGTFWFQDWKNHRLTKLTVNGKIIRTVSTKFLKTWRSKFYVNMNFAEHERWVWSYDSLYEITNDRLKQVKSDWGFLGIDSLGFTTSSEFVRKHPYTGHYWFSVGNFSKIVDEKGNVLYTYRDKGSYVNNRDVFIGNNVLQPTSKGLNVYSLYPSQFQSFKDGVKGGYRGINKIGGDYIVCNNDIGVRVIKSNLKKELAHLSYVGDASYRYKDLLYTIGRQTINVINKNKRIERKLHVPYAHEVWGMIVEDSFMYYSTLGLIEFNLYTENQRTITSNEFPELNTSTIYSIQKKGNDEYWLCTTAGIYSWNSRNDAFKKYLDEVDGCSEFQHLWQNGDLLWLASGCKGLVQFNLRTKKTQVFDFAHNATNITHCVYPDNSGNLWLSTDFEVVRFNVKDKTYETFSKNDGLVNNEFNRISHFREIDGTLIFGGITGMVRFHPDSLANVKSKTINITPIIADVWLYKKGQKEISQITKSFIDENTITIEPQDRLLAFDLATKSIANSDKIEFSYQFGEDSIWNILPSNRLEFNIMPFGEHKVTLRARLPNKRASQNVIAFSLKVVKPVYLRAWFVITVVLSLLFVSVFAVIIRTNQLDRQKQLLEEEVNKRTQKILDDKAIIEKQAAELKTLDRLKNRFFANISHELRNPLTLIVGPVESLLSQEKVRVPDMVRSQMNLTLKNAKSLQKRINEILSLSKIDAGKLKLVFAPTNANQFFSRVVLAHDSWAKSKSVGVSFTSELSEKLNLDLDQDNVEKVVNNLVSNAIKHSPQRSNILVKLTLASEKLYSVVVKDQGKGIEEGEGEKIFDRYYQSKEGEKAGGTGLGLALSREIAQLMDGNLTAQNTAEGGAEFIFTFKANVSTSEVIEYNEIENTIAFEEASEVIAIGKTNANILVVDDNEEMRTYIRSILSDDFKIFEAENGRDALELIEKRNIDLITSDLMMPVMDGMEFLSAHKQSEKANIPVIMITARADDADRLGALEIGVDDYLTKPFYARELKARIKNLLSYRRLKSEVENDTELLKEDGAEQLDDATQITGVIEMINANINDNNLSVADIADGVGYSERQLRRIIKKQKGITPNALIKELRLLQARKFLENQNFSTVAEVMSNCGFKSQGHFAKGYFQRFGKKPSEYFD
ncbi:MAG: response regulator [Bacteroidia bacterium]